MTAAGAFGLGGEYWSLADVASLGAVVVGPVTARPRAGSTPPRIVSFGGGLLLSTGTANPGISRLIRGHQGFWVSAGAPVIVHVAAVSYRDVTACCARLSELEGVAAIELGIPDEATLDEATDLVNAALGAAAQPVIVRVPLASAANIAVHIARCGISALTVASPPHGELPDHHTGRMVAGRLYGPFVLPLVVHAVRSVAERVAVPIIGSGGVWGVEDARALLDVGCAAVQLGGAIWRDPGLVSRLVDALSQ
jgi:dihydroorotate dehydrogenase (NAD+) catalytic subunit